MKLNFTNKEVFILVAVSLMSFLANLPESLGGDLINRKLLLGTLAAVVIIAMFRYLKVLLLMIISILAIGANMPLELAQSLGVSQTAMLVSLALLIAITLANRVLHLLPTTAEEADAESYETPDEEAPEDLSVIGARHMMFTAISKGDLATLRKMIAVGSEINFTLDGMTPLHMATEKGYSRIVQLLIDHGADLLAENAQGKTPLDVALAVKKFAKTTDILYDATIPYLTSPQAD